MRRGGAGIDPATVNVLLVEDEPMIAMDMEERLRGLGFRNIWHAASIDEGVALMQREDLGLASLDVNVGTALVFPLAEAMRRRGVPFFFASGRPRHSFPSDYQSQVILAKPVGDSALIEALQRLNFAIATDTAVTESVPLAPARVLQ